jgi:hypothetical protein
MLRTEAVLHRDAGKVERFALDLIDRYMGSGPEFEPARDMFRAQVPKRVAIEFRERSRVTWDHGKLGGAY